MKSNSQILKNVTSASLADLDNDTLLTVHNNKKHIEFDSGQQKKVMVADDDPAIIDVLTLMLQDAGYKVYTSANGQTVADVTTLCPDVLLLDVLMSGINGYDICRELKNQLSTKDIPIIMISANKDEANIVLDACADDFIKKPFEMNDLLRKVAKYSKV